VSLLWLRDQTQTHHTRQDFSGRVIGQSKEPPPDMKLRSQETDKHAHGSIQTRNNRKQAFLDHAAIGIDPYIDIRIYIFSKHKITHFATL
jgi:hypothetical protein